MTAIPSTPPDPATHASQRRARLIERLTGSKLDGALITDPRDITYFTASQLGTSTAVPACLLVRTSGEAVLACGESEVEHHVDRIVPYRWHDGGTIPTELMPRLVEHAAPHFGPLGLRIGVQVESVSSQLVSGLSLGSFLAIDRIVLDLQRTKDSLDLFRLNGAIQANLAALNSAEMAIKPGANELEVFAAAVRGATLRAGERIVHDGDYRCGSPSGACRNRIITSGELYTIDAWTNRAGYWSDLARVFPVGTASDEQSQLIRHVGGVHDRIRPMLRPGISGAEIWLAMDAALRERPDFGTSGLVHHGGHGIGVRLHEAPDINPGVTDTLRAGDVICIEPGAYTASGNVRIEETYLIAPTGAFCLSRAAND